jgi:membrane protease YdiL (CAAX protease family)
MSKPSSSLAAPMPADWGFAVTSAIYILLVGMLARIVVVGVEVVAHRVEPARLWLVTSPFGVLTALVAVEGLLFALALSRLHGHAQLSTKLRGELRLDGFSTLLGVLLVVGIGPATNGAAFAVAKVANLDIRSVEAMSLLVRHAAPLEFACLLLGLSLIPAVVEELLFRGVVQGALSDARPVAAVLLQALAFGVFHADVTQGLATVLLGLGLGFVRHQSRSLGSSMVAHAAYNASVVLSLRFVVSPPSTSSPTALFEIVGGLAVAVPAALLLLHRARGRSRG